MSWRDYLKPAERRTLDRLDKLIAEATGAQKTKRAIYDRCRKRLATAERMAKETK